MTELPLFPLKIVIFPESIIPLHIFEERYKILISDCMANETVFGINLNDDKLHNIGTTARVDSLIKKYSDGRMDVLVEGVQRYRLNNFSESEFGYYVGNIDYLEDEIDELNLYLLRNCVNMFNLIVDSIPDLKMDKIITDELKTKFPSFFLATKSGFTLRQKQELLEMRSENRRLEMIRTHLNKVIPLIKESETVNNIIKNDGFFRPDFLDKE